MEQQNIQQKKSLKQTLFEVYNKKYKALLVIPFLILFFSLAQIGWQVYKTGDFIKRDVSLKGGVTVTIPYDREVDAAKLARDISSRFPGNDIAVRTLGTASVVGVVVEADINGNDKAQVKSLLESIQESLNTDLSKVNYGLEVVGSSLGASFFKESLNALYVAFLFMGLVVFLYFGTNLLYKILAALLAFMAMVFVLFSNSLLLQIASYAIGAVLIAIYAIDSVPSIAVILAAFSDMVFSLAVVNLFGMRVGTAGIAAFLMVIGYSVDTDILLTVRVLKRKEGTVMDRIVSSIKTGMTETLTAMVAVLVAMFVTQSGVIRQIMIILFVGLIADIFNTWIQNVGLLRMHVEKKARQGIAI